MPRWSRAWWRRHALAAAFLALALVTALGVWRVEQTSRQGEQLAKETQRLAVENSNRIADIQAARLASCKQTYEGVREIFRPQFPPMPNPTQKQALRTFNKTVDDLKAGCANQTKTKEAP